MLIKRQNWPAPCDPFDRSFEIRLDPPADDGDPPAIELMHAITPFGGPEHQAIDVTDIANARPGLHLFDAMISTGADPLGLATGTDAGWDVNAHLDVVPGPAPHDGVVVFPLLDGVATADQPLPTASFELPDGVTEARIELRATGHGGGDVDDACIGPADEFCKRTHHADLDGVDLVDGWVPWRGDCACTMVHDDTYDYDYCAENPFGDPRSVRASRANWCPGTLTPPRVTALPSAAPGAHTLDYAIDGIGTGGRWRVSALVVAW